MDVPEINSLGKYGEATNVFRVNPGTGQPVQENFTENEARWFAGSYWKSILFVSDYLMHKTRFEELRRMGPKLSMAQVREMAAIEKELNEMEETGDFT